MSVAITGWTTLNAWGLGREAFADALSRRRVPPVSGIEVKGMPGVAPYPFLKADLSAVKEYFPPRALRRVDPFGKMAMLLAAALLKDKPPAEREPLGLIVATAFGSFSTNMEFLETIFAGGFATASPMVFTSTVHNSAMAASAIHFGLRGPAITVSMFEHSVPGALMLAEAWLESGFCKELLLIAADDFPSLAAYYHARVGDTPDVERFETLHAEGGAAFMLGTTGPLVLRRGEGETPAVLRPCAHAYGRTYLAPAFDLAAACLALEGGWKPDAPFDREQGVMLEFPGWPRRLLKRRA